MWKARLAYHVSALSTNYKSDVLPRKHAMNTKKSIQEGSLDTPTRYPIDWKTASFRDQSALNQELERVFDVCHGCRRCVSLCHAFPTLFDLIDESETMEVDGVAQSDYGKVVDHCYLCDLCYLTKCPYVPPHEWAIDFPHLMLRAKTIRFEKGASRLRDRALTATDRIASLAGVPVVAQTVNVLAKNKALRKLGEKVLGVAAEAPLPKVHVQSLRRRLSAKCITSPDRAPEPINTDSKEQPRVLVFVSCYGNRYAPQQTEDLIAILEHNGVQTAIMAQEKCCGMPKLELGDIKAVEKLKQYNVPRLSEWARAGWLITSPIPSCVLMFKKELPLLFPEDVDLALVAGVFHDPFDYLMGRHRQGLLKTTFEKSLGKVVWHVACHQRVQNIGPRTRQILQLIPDTEVEMIERCSGHDGIYAYKAECHDKAVKICKPVSNRIRQSDAAYYISDCPMAASFIGSRAGKSVGSPFSLLRQAYGV